MHDGDSRNEAILNLLARGEMTASAAAALLAVPHQRTAAEPVAVLGTAVRLPGAQTLEELWGLVANARDVIRPFPADRFDLVAGANEDMAQAYAGRRAELAASDQAHGSWLDGIDQFEPEAFGLSKFEAEFLGPAERLLLQTASEALTASGLVTSALAGSRTGVFLAYQPAENFEYLKLFDDPDERAFVSAIPANAAYRVAYTFDLRGPVMNVDTTCSSSLAALHLARRSLQLEECDVAVVAGISLTLFPFWHDNADYFVRSPRFRCSAYDARADGVVWGEGAIAVVLKRAAAAIRDGDGISAIVTGSAIGSDGLSSGLQAPNPDGHARVVRAALAEAGVPADTIGYLEGHGTGTKLGDLVEVDGLTRAFREDTDRVGYCRLGSIKSIVGHLGDAAGLAGFMAALMRIRHRMLPALAGLQEPNPAIAWRDTPFAVSKDTEPWPTPTGGGPRRAGVSSLGISGTNVHVIVEEYQSPDAAGGSPAPPLLLSATSRWSLWEFARRLASGVPADAGLGEVARTLARRPPGRYRVGVFAADRAELADKLGQLLEVRAFDKVPEQFYGQGIFVADSADTAAVSMARLDAGAFTAAEPDDLRLMADFLASDDVGSRYLARTAGWRVIPLPVAPFTTRRIWPSAAADDALDTAGLFFAADWVPASPVSPSGVPGGLVVIFARRDDAVSPAVRERFMADGAEVVLVRAGDAFAQTGPDDFEISPVSPGDYADLWARLGAARTGRLATIVHAFSLAAGGDPMADLEALEDSQRAGVHSLFHLTRSIVAAGLTNPMVLAVVSANTQCVTPSDSGNYAPARVTAFGFARVVSQELPHVAELSIDHDLGGEPETIAADIAAELCLGPRERLPLVAYREGRRYTKQVSRKGEGGGRELPIRRGGVYVIAGGTGYLGPEVARFLADRGAGTVVLLSRNGLPPREEWDRLAVTADAELAAKLDTLRTVEAAGTTVVSLACDITDPGAVRRAFDLIGAGYGPVSGGFMLAKQLFHQWIADLDFGSFKQGIDNRVRGTWLLSQELRAAGADFLVLFSSVSSMIGTKGAAECSAVNQFLDSVGPYLSERGIRTSTLNLTLVLDDKAEFAAKTPIPPIDFAHFRAALERFFRDAGSLDVVMELDLAEVHYLRPVLRIPFADQVWDEAAAHVDAAAARSGQPAGESAATERDEIAERLAGAWRTVLGLPHPAADANFFAEGGTSLSAIRLVHVVGRELPDLGFDVTDVYAFPTFEAQLARLTDRPPPEEKAAAVPAADGGDGDGVEAIFARLERGELSSDDAAALLAGGSPAPRSARG
jgi:3-oxoacyl-(acyl-carrier-protein) synthase/NAD(P)-dependent dehydrogenase (short-subunit alcohol dehydrogenase family)